MTIRSVRVLSFAIANSKTKNDILEREEGVNAGLWHYKNILERSDGKVKGIKKDGAVHALELEWYLNKQWNLGRQFEKVEVDGKKYIICEPKPKPIPGFVIDDFCTPGISDLMGTRSSRDYDKTHLESYVLEVKERGQKVEKLLIGIKEGRFDPCDHSVWYSLMELQAIEAIPIYAKLLERSSHPSEAQERAVIFLGKVRTVNISYPESSVKEVVLPLLIKKLKEMGDNNPNKKLVIWALGEIGKKEQHYYTDSLRNEVITLVSRLLRNQMPFSLGDTQYAMAGVYTLGNLHAGSEIIIGGSRILEKILFNAPHKEVQFLVLEAFVKIARNDRAIIPSILNIIRNVRFADKDVQKAVQETREELKRLSK